MEEISQDVDIAKELSAVPHETPETTETTEVVKETKPEVKTEEKHKTMVPHEALHEARLETRELREQLRQIRETSLKSEERFQKFLEAAAKDAAPKAPDFREDPFGSIQHENAALKKQLEELTGKVKEVDNFRTVSVQSQQLQSQVASHAREFMKTKPDYPEAYQYIRSVRSQDLADLGTPTEQIQQILENEEIGLATAALRGGKNPAEVLYGIASRYGYKPVAKPNNGVDNASKLETIQKGQDVSKSQGGGKPDSPLTLEALSKMDEDEFSKIISDDKLWRKAIGAS